MKASHTLIAIFFAISASAGAQVVPAATRPIGMPLSGSLHYDVRYTQTAQFYPGNGRLQRSSVSGDVSYLNGNTSRPFTLTYSGGVVGISGANVWIRNIPASNGITRFYWTIRIIQFKR